MKKQQEGSILAYKIDSKHIFFHKKAPEVRKNLIFFLSLWEKKYISTQKKNTLIFGVWNACIVNFYKIDDEIYKSFNF